MATLKTFLSGFAALSLVAGGTLIALPGGSSTAYAQSASKSIVDSAKARGEIGEQVDGYLGVVAGKSPAASVTNAMLEINIARKAVYTEVSAGSGQPASVFAKLTGEKQIKKAAQGTYVKDTTGSWKKK